MSREFKGVIIEESLTDNRIINNLEIIGVRLSKDENPMDRWHIYTVHISKEKINELAKNIKPKWYAHFWKDRNVIAVFKDKIFEFDFDHKSTWKPAVEYGLSQGIPKEQLDFPID